MDNLTGKEMHRAMTLTLRQAALNLLPTLPVPATMNDAVAKLSEKLPAPFKLYLSSHDTGCQATILLEEEGKLAIRVWAGSMWETSLLEANDKREVGMNGEVADFAQAIVQKFFEDVTASVQTQPPDNAPPAVVEKPMNEAETIEYYREKVKNPTAQAQTSDAAKG